MSMILTPVYVVKPEYAAMARRRIENPEPEPEIPDVEGQTTMEFAR